jgi:hypothetical protein
MPSMLEVCSLDNDYCLIEHVYYVQLYAEKETQDIRKLLQQIRENMCLGPLWKINCTKRETNGGGNL